MIKNIKIDYIETELLEPNSWNPNRVSEKDLEKLDQSIQELGAFKPILVRHHPEIEDKYQILAGEHRWKTYKMRGEETLPCINLGVVSDVDAKRITVLDDNSSGEYDSDSFADLLSSLPDASLSILPYEHAEMTALMSVSDLDFDSLQDPEGDQIDYEEGEPDTSAPDTSRTIRCKIPQDKVDLVLATMDKVMNEHNIDSPDTQANMGEVLTILCEKEL